MMLTVGRSSNRDRLVTLERMVDALTGRLREVQWELQQTKTEAIAARAWRGLLHPNRNGAGFMSEMCNRQVRSNTKVTSHAASRI
jgi:hypothetical protein